MKSILAVRLLQRMVFVFIPRPSYVVPFWVVYVNPLPKNHDIPKKELHRSPLVRWCLGSRGPVAIVIKQMLDFSAADWRSLMAGPPN